MKSIIKTTLIILILLSDYSHSKSVNILAWVNDEIITNEDINYQIQIKKNILNKIIYEINLENELLELIEKKIKEQEVKRKKITLNQKIIENSFNTFVNQNNINLIYLDKNQHLKNLIKKEINTEILWIELIRNTYAWKLNVNMYEIENRVNNFKKNLNDLEKKNLKNQIYLSEKNKKFKVYEKQYLNMIKKNSFIKINEK